MEWWGGIMKIQKTIVTFSCDNCDKKLETEAGFPYLMGWVYLYDVNIQKGNVGMLVGDRSPMRLTQRDKHFCCKECLMRFVEKMCLK